MEMINALNTASDRNIGVSGYFSIILFNGKAPNNERMIGINDHRAKLASEIMHVKAEKLISSDTTYGLIDKLLFNGGTFHEVNDLLLKNTGNPHRLRQVLRGYK
jgi:hypothetical protein